MNDEEKYYSVYLKGLSLNNTTKSQLSPDVLERYGVFCQKLINENSNASLSLLYISAAQCFRMIRDFLDCGIPTVNIP